MCVQVILIWWRPQPLLQICLDERHSALKSAQDQVPRHSASNSIDGSEDSFSAYLRREDKKIQRAESQSADAHDIRVSVCSHLYFLSFPRYAQLDNLGCPTLRYSRDIHRCVHQRSSNRPSRQVGILSRKNLRTALRGQTTRKSLTFFDPRRSLHVFSAEFGRLDQLVLVLEPGRQPDVHSAVFAGATMGQRTPSQSLCSAAD